MEESGDLLQLIGPPGTLVLGHLVKDCTPLVAPVNYSPSNALTISSAPQATTKPVLIIEGGGAEQVLEIGGVTRTERVY